MKTIIKISLLLAIIILVTGCNNDDVDDIQLKIRITDIPAEYEGKIVTTNLGTADNLYQRASSFNQNTIIMYGEVTTKLLTVSDYLDTPFTEKGEFRIDLLIYDLVEKKYIWTGQSSDIINITKETTTISFNALTKWD